MRTSVLPQGSAYVYAMFLGSVADRNYMAPELPHRIVMPCGSEFVCETVDDIPDKDVPCPCGDPKHWLVKYKERTQ